MEDPRIVCGIIGGVGLAVILGVRIAVWRRTRPDRKDLAALILDRAEERRRAALHRDY